MFFQALSLLGAVLILVAYAAAQMSKMSTGGTNYQLLNLIGSTALCVAAIAALQYGFILLEGSWAVLSVWGLWKVRRTSA